ncbi:hypothetical protein [Deinococcus enclensis]|uniref:Lipoprotein n=1 Tax=Deinococcus enclensis TaxID=1049582 RepID=A0ABT9MDK7_9DEIO|nr:hypothetical protein [Deinococcus enclensis]MDP9764657.1 hypothetical protein [Deinococcus enclensis]
MPHPTPARPRLLGLTALLGALLTACTGTTEDLPVIRLALLTDGGQTLRTLTPGPESAANTDDATLPIQNGVRVDVLANATRYALTRRAGIDSRPAPNPPPAEGQAFTAPPAAQFPAGPCFTAVALSAGRDRLLALSDCPNDVQRLALYRADGSLVWTARLPVYLPPSGQEGVPPARLAVLTDTSTGIDTGIVARPVLGGGSEVLRVAPQQIGNPLAEVISTRATDLIRDLAPYAGGIVAATDTGLQPLRDTGALNPEATLRAFGATRYDRVWSVPVGGTPLLAAWRSNIRAGTTSQPLRLWDGRATQTDNSAATVDAFVADLRDVTVDPQGFLYALTATTLTRYDTALGLAQGSWRSRLLLSGLTDARSVTWVLP